MQIIICMQIQAIIKSRMVLLEKLGSLLKAFVLVSSVARKHNNSQLLFNL